MTEYDFSRYLNVRSASWPAILEKWHRIAFLSDISGSYQVWSVSIDDDGRQQWPRQLTFFDNKVWEIYAAPDGSCLLAVSDEGGNERQQFYLISEFGEDGDGFLHHAVRRLTTDDQAVHRFGAWSSDGSRIAYASNARNGVDFDVYMMDVDSGDTRMLFAPTGNCVVVAWSPDNSRLLVLTAVASEQEELQIYNVDTGDVQYLTANCSPARYHGLNWTERGLFTISDRDVDRFALCHMDLETGALEQVVSANALLDELGVEDGELEDLVLDGSGDNGVLVLNAAGHSVIYSIDLCAGTSQRLNALPVGVVGNLMLDKQGSRLVLDIQGPRNNPDIWLYEFANQIVRQVTFSDRAGIPAATFVQPETVHFMSFDGRKIPSLFYRPSGAPPEGGYPCILYVHGGPAYQQRPDFDVRFQYFLRQGYALFVTNVRGSTGYGRQYMMLDDVEKRMDSVADLQHAVRWLQGRDEIAWNRIAIYGRSYGGFMVLAALAEYPDLFAAGIDVVGISNWITFLQRTSAWRRQHRSREYGNEDDNTDLLVKMSPINKVDRIRVPLMVLAGDNDPRVPLSESEQIVERVRKTGGTVEFVHYADEGHRFSKLSNRVDSFTKMAAFLKQYL